MKEAKTKTEKETKVEIRKETKKVTKIKEETEKKLSQQKTLTVTVCLVTVCLE